MRGAEWNLSIMLVAVAMTGSGCGREGQSEALVRPTGGQAARVEPLAGVQPQALVCRFKSVSNGVLGARYEPGRSKDTLDVTFAGLSPSTRSAQMIGNAGTAQVTMLSEPGQLIFIEDTPIGNRILTTVMTEGSGEGYPAVHSRHTVMTGAGEMMVSQMVGLCEPRI